MAYENIIVEDDGPIRIITMNRPKALNALNKATLGELSRAIEDTNNKVDNRVLVITGAGDKAFVAGADITEMKDMTADDAEALSKRGHEVFHAIETLEVPAIAAVNGFALGGGLELALACDFIWASDNARLGLVEANLGLIPGFAGTVRLPRRVGRAMAAELIYSAAQVKADEALRIGLVNRVLPAAELMTEVKKLAATIAEKGPVALTKVKQLLNDDDEPSFAPSSTREQRAFGAIFNTADKAEGVGAFLEKRKASFKGA